MWNNDDPRLEINCQHHTHFFIYKTPYSLPPHKSTSTKTYIEIIESLLKYQYLITFPQCYTF